MDDRQFDAITQAFAAGLTRRGAVRALVGGLAGTAAGLFGRPTALLAEPEGAVPACGGACSRGEQCVAGDCCPLGQACDSVCCPPENVGCTEAVLPDGTVIVGCLCKEGTKWEPETNECIPCPVACARGDECCAGLCCDGVCCAKDAVCCAGVCCGMGEVCSAAGKCVARECCSGRLVCGLLSGLDQCCAHPQVSACCCESRPGAGDGWIGCCTLGVNCINDPQYEEFHREIGCESEFWMASHYGWNDDNPSICKSDLWSDVITACPL